MLRSPSSFLPLRAMGLGLVVAACMSSLGCAQVLAQLDESRGVRKIAVDEPVPMTADEIQVLNATNAYRSLNGLPELKPDARLVLIARQRSRDMAKRSYFGHVTPEGSDVFTIMRTQKVGFWAAGENLARNTYPASESVEVAMKGWIKSAEHRANLLHPAFGHLGVGGAIAADGKRYFTQVFTD